MHKHILCIGFTPALQRILKLPELRIGEVTRAQSCTFSPAGKGVNVAKVLKTLGSDPQLTGFLAGTAGARIDEALSALDIQGRWVWGAGETRNAHTLIDESTGAVTELVEEAQDPSAEEWKKALHLIDTCLTTCERVALCGALPPDSDPGIYQQVVRLCHTHQVDVVMDAKGEALTLALSEQPYFVKMNVEELAYTTGMRISSEQEIVRGLKTLHDRGARHVLVTQGKEAAYCFDGESVWQFAPPQVEAINPIGSGDSVTAGILHALGEGQSLVEAVAYGMACGSANAETVGPGELALHRVEALLLEVKVVKIESRYELI